MEESPGTRTSIPGDHAGVGAAVKAAVILLLAVTLAGRLWVAQADHRRLIGADVWQDDAFYYLKIAQNILGGRGVTFDGHTPTNGFHPLYMALVVPVTLAAPENPALAMHLIGVLLALVAVGTGALIFMLQRRLSGACTALTALALWAVSPYFTVFGVNGQETGLAILFTVLLIILYHRLITEGSGAGWGDYALTGFAGGVAILARLDLAILLLALLTDWLSRVARKKVPRGAWKKVVVAALLVLVVYLPWGVAGWMLTGSPMTASGAASRQIAQELGWTFLDRFWSTPESPATSSSAGWHADVATKLLGVFALEWPLTAPFRLNVPFDVWPDLKRFGPFAQAPQISKASAALALLLLLGFAGAVAVRLAGRGNSDPEPGLPVAFGVYLLLFFMGYVFYSPAHWYFSRYLTAPVLVATVWGLHLSRGTFSRSGARRPWLRRFVPAAIFVLVACQASLAWGWLGQFAATRATAGFLTSWERLGPGTDAAAPLGSFQAGIISVFSGREVINLDGKVNPEAYDAIRRRRLHEYIGEQGIRYIMDWDWIVYALCVRHAPPGGLRLEKVGQEPDGARLSLWRVN